MSTARRNLEDQDSSIKSRANEVFSDTHELAPVKSFAEYVRRTPPTPLAIEMKALLWIVGIIIAMLFCGALLRVQKGARRPRPVRVSSRLVVPGYQMQESSRAETSLTLAPTRLDSRSIERAINAV